MMKRFVLMAFCLFIAGFLSADVYIKSVMHNDPITVMGQTQPATDSTIEQWIGADKMAMVTPELTTIMDVGKKIAFIINHKEKTYVQTTYPFNFSSLLDVPPEAQQMMNAMKMTVKVSPTTETKKIDQWNCNAYHVEMSVMGMPIKSKVWASKDVPFDWKKYTELTVNTLGNMQNMFDSSSINEYKKIEGVHIFTETNGEMMGAKIHSTVKVAELSQKNAPASVFTVPAGYKKVEKFSAMNFGR